jgi:Protein of unknown function (DUF4199)
MRKIILTFGLIGGGIMSIMMLLTMPFEDKIGADRGEIIGYTTMVLAFLLVYFGVRSYRDTQSGGTISFGRAFKVGILITLVSSACYVATWELIYYTMDTGFADKYAARVIDDARASGATPTELEAKRKDMQHFKEMYANPLYNIAMTFVEPLPVGLIVTLVSAGFLSRRRKERIPLGAHAA